MFNWVLKLLGINESRPSASGDAYLGSKTKSTTAEKTVSKTVKEPTAKAASKVKPKPKPKAASKPKPAPKKEPVATAKNTDSSPKPASTALGNEFPALKANYITMLEDAGFSSKALIDKASDKELLAIKGIGKATLKLMRD